MSARTMDSLEYKKQSIIIYGHNVGWLDSGFIFRPRIDSGNIQLQYVIIILLSSSSSCAPSHGTVSALGAPE